MADVKAGQKVRVWDGSNELGELTSAPFIVQLSDGTSAIGTTGGSLDVNITGGATSGTEFAEDSVHASGALGTMILAVRNDTLAALADTDGDYAPLQVDASGAVYVNISNASIPVTDNGGSLTVDGTVAATQSGTWTVDLGATDNAVLDQIELNTDFGTVIGGGTEATALRVTIANDSTGVLTVDDGGGSLTVDGTVAATQSGTWTVDLGATDNAVLDQIELNTDFGTVVGGGTEATALRVTIANDSTGVVSIDDNGGSITVDGSVTVSATQLDVDDLNLTDDAVRVSGNSSANSETNPIYVKTVNTVASGSEIHDYNTAAAVASDATNNHTYTVVGTTFLLKKIIVSASSAAKWVIQCDAATKAVAFTSEANQTREITFEPAIECSTNVVIARTNFDNQAQDVYSTIIGNDI